MGAEGHASTEPSKVTDASTEPRKVTDASTEPSKMTEVLLTSLFFAEVIGAFLVLPYYLPLGCPISPASVPPCLAVCCVLVFTFIKLVKLTSGAVASFISRNFLRGNPLRKHRARAKCEDQCWQLWIHTTMTAMEVYVLYVDGGGEPWLRDHTSLWIPHPREQVHDKASVHALYVAQMAIWIVTAFSHQFFEKRHKDYAMMYIHHIVTIALIGLSYTWGYVRIGVPVLLLHDSSDIIIDLLKICNYMKLEGLRHGFLVEICFFSNLIAWAYTRLYLFPYYVVYLGSMVGPRETLLGPTSPRVGAAKAITRGHAPGWKYPTSLGDGTFQLLPNIAALPTHEEIPGWWTFNTLLCALILMHIIWYILLLRIVYRLMTKSFHEAGADEYEGDSD